MTEQSAKAPSVPPNDPAVRPSQDSLAPAYATLRAGLRRFVRRRVDDWHVDDLVQEVFVRMQSHAGELRDEQRLAGWAFRIAANVVADHHRRAKTRGVHAERTEPDELPVERETTDENATVAGWLRPMIALLPAEYAEALELVELQGLTQREYAERAGLSLSGAKSRVQRGRKMLEGIVRACCDLEQDARGNVIGYSRRGESCACAPRCRDERG
jgi:RNA polymerase sigma-70 factor (ECF subfamily)